MLGVSLLIAASLILITRFYFITYVYNTPDKSEEDELRQSEYEVPKTTELEVLLEDTNKM